MIKVYFVGASGVGKTTLARHVSESTGLPMLPSAVRNVMKTMAADVPPSRRVACDVAVADSFQRAVWAEQLAIEAAAESFVSDRAFEAVAYSADQSRVTKAVADSGLAAYVGKLAEADRIVFFVRPDRSIVEASADGVRDRWISWECVNRIDGVVQFVLESHGVRYVPIIGPCLRDRVRLVDAFLAAKGVIDW